MKVKLNHPTHGRILTLKGSRTAILRTLANFLVTHYPNAVANVASVSGGLSSSVAARRLIQKEGAANCIQWYADTRFEDEDSYRYMADTRDKEGTLVIIYTDGRTPVDVWDTHSLIPNNFKAPCTKELKIAPFKIFIRALSKALIRRAGGKVQNDAKLGLALPTFVTLALGMDWKEMHRMAAPKANYESIPGVKVIFPLMWLPYEKGTYYDLVKSWGVTPPRAYDLGFDHNNCGFRCCRQGAKAWKKLYTIMPDRFFFMANWERKAASKDNARRGKAMLTRVVKGKKSPLPLYNLLEEPIELAPAYELYKDDRTNCYCTY